MGLDTSSHATRPAAVFPGFGTSCPAGWGQPNSGGVELARRLHRTRRRDRFPAAWLISPRFGSRGGGTRLHCMGTSRGHPRISLELAAIAQHHGVPTRLLDFTFNPLVAAYFAAAQPTPSAYLAVWAVDVEFIRTAWASFDRGIRVVQVSRG